MLGVRWYMWSSEETTEFQSLLLPDGAAACRVGYLGGVIQGWGGNPSLESESETWTLPPQLREKYGDVFIVYLGSWPVVILWGYEAMREALVDQAKAFSGRGRITIIDPVFQGTGEWGMRVRIREGRRDHPMCLQNLPSTPHHQVWILPVESLGRFYSNSLWPPWRTLGWGSGVLSNNSRRNLSAWWGSFRNPKVSVGWVEVGMR